MGTAKGKGGPNRNRVGVKQAPVAVTSTENGLVHTDTGMLVSNEELADMEQLNGERDEAKLRETRPAWFCAVELTDGGNVDSEGSTIARGIVKQVIKPSAPPHNAPHPDGFPTPKVGDQVFICPFSFRAGSPPLPTNAGPGTVIITDLQWQGDAKPNVPWQSGYIHRIQELKELTAETKAGAMGNRAVDSLVESVKSDITKLAELRKSTPAEIASLPRVREALEAFREGLGDEDPGLQRAKSAAGTLQAELGQLLAPVTMVDAKKRAIGDFDAWLNGPAITEETPAPAPPVPAPDPATVATPEPPAPAPLAPEDQVETVAPEDAVNYYFAAIEAAEGTAVDTAALEAAVVADDPKAIAKEAAKVILAADAAKEAAAAEAAKVATSPTMAELIAKRAA